MFESQGFKDKMATLERRHEEVAALLGTAEVINKRSEFLKLSREHAELDPLVTAWKSYQKLLADLAQAKQMAEAETDGELREMAREEVRQLEDSKITAGPKTYTVIERAGQYGVRLKDKESKLRSSFTGMRWFPVRESYRVSFGSSS